MSFLSILKCILVSPKQQKSQVAQFLEILASTYYFNRHCLI